MTYEKLIEDAISDNVSSKDKMYESVAMLSNAMERHKEDCSELVNEIMKSQYEIFYGTSMSKSMSCDIVSEMESSDAEGEIYSVDFARKVKQQYNLDAGVYDVYVALNATWHDFHTLYGKWFGTPTDDHYIMTAISFWFNDDDYDGDKVWNYFMKK